MTHNIRRLGLMGLVVALTVGSRCRRAELVYRSPWDNWIMFDQPESGMRLGLAWSLAGAPDAGCYGMADSLPDGQSWKTYNLDWSDTTNAALRLSVARAIGFGASMSSAASGSIHFDSLVIKRAVSPGALARCPTSKDGLPTRPGIVALLGAKSLAYSLTTASGANIDAKTNLQGGDTATVSFRTVDNKTTQATFTDFRWVGAQFLSLEKTLTPADTEFTPDFTLGSHYGLHWGIDVVVSRSQGRLSIVFTLKQPPFSADTILASEGQVFPIFSPKDGLVQGEYHIGQAWLNAMGTHSRLRVQRGLYKRLEWNRREQRDTMLAWVKDKAG